MMRSVLLGFEELMGVVLPAHEPTWDISQAIAQMYSMNTATRTMVTMVEGSLSVSSSTFTRLPGPS